MLCASNQYFYILLLELLHIILQETNSSNFFLKQKYRSKIEKNRFFVNNGSHKFVEGGRGVMVFNTTFNNISVISWRSVLSVEETGVPGENH